VADMDWVMPTAAEVIRAEDFAAQMHADRIADELLQGHLRILAMPWVACGKPCSQCAPRCPSCCASPFANDHERDCAWLIAARACGVLP